MEEKERCLMILAVKNGRHTPSINVVCTFTIEEDSFIKLNPRAPEMVVTPGKSYCARTEDFCCFIYCFCHRLQAMCHFLQNSVVA